MPNIATSRTVCDRRKQLMPLTKGWVSALTKGPNTFPFDGCRPTDEAVLRGIAASSAIPDPYLPTLIPVGAAGDSDPTDSVEAKTRIPAPAGAGKVPGAVDDAHAAKTKLPMHAIPL